MKIQAKPIDCIKVNMKAKDVGLFFATSFDSFLKKHPISVFQNPGFASFQAHVDTFKYADWSVANLRNKGYQVASRIVYEPNQKVSFYFLSSEKAKKHYLRMFEGKANKFSTNMSYDFRENPNAKKTVFQKISDNIISNIERIKDSLAEKSAKSIALRFSKTVEPSLKDCFYNDELKYLYNERYNYFTQKRFDKFIDKLSKLELEFKVKHANNQP